MTSAEDVVIGMALNDPGCLGNLIDAGLSPTMFDNERAALLFAKMLESDKAGRDCGLASMGALLPQLAQELVALATAAPVAQEVGHYVREVMAGDMQRRLARELSSLATRLLARKPFGDIAPFRQEAARILGAVGESPEANGPVPIAAVMDRVLEKIEAAMTGNAAAAIPTGLRVLDKALSGGWRAGMLYFPAARPGKGKTTFAVNAMDAASAAGKAAVFFTVEMPIEQIGQKHLSMASRVRGTRLERGDLYGEEQDRLIHAVKELHARPVWIDDSSRGDMSTIAARCRKLKRQGNLDVAFVDYLQLLRAPGRFSSRVAELSEITGALKRLALELKIAIVCLSTINREAEKYGEPGLQHLKDSGSIEQDADAVIIFHVDDEERTQVNVAKNRHGPQVRFFIEVDLSISAMRDGDGRDPQEVANV